jgi:hypothetical protein
MTTKILQRGGLVTIALAGSAFIAATSAHAQTTATVADATITTGSASWLLWLIPSLALGIIGGIGGFALWSAWQARAPRRYYGEEVALTGVKGGEAERKPTENDIYVADLNRRIYNHYRRRT